jgi:hypothetical protein
MQKKPNCLIRLRFFAWDVALNPRKWLTFLGLTHDYGKEFPKSRARAAIAAGNRAADVACLVFYQEDAEGVLQVRRR